MCDCDPGNPQNGWHETRGPKCAAEDRAAWAEFFARVPEMIATVTRKR